MVLPFYHLCPCGQTQTMVVTKPRLGGKHSPPLRRLSSPGQELLIKINSSSPGLHLPEAILRQEEG